LKKRVLVPIVLFSALSLFATEIPKRIHHAQPLQSSTPAIDGRLDDACWQGEGWTGDFIQQQPNEGQPGREKTTFKILYDERYVYVAIHCDDRSPKEMEVRFSRRDNFAGDCVGICFDSYNDQRTGYEFNINSGGGKIDLMQMDTGADWFIDYNWDAVWDGKTAIEDSGWAAEMRIPFSQLRFAGKEEQVWGLHVWRWTHRYMEESQFQLIPLDSQGRVHRFGILKGIKEIPSPRRVEFLPYLNGSLKTFEPIAGNPFKESGRKQVWNMGLDGRIGLSGNFNLDFTMNPDFGQVEADPSVVNLTAFETFYDEKRPFFMEGKQVLDFDVAGQPLFYSRRIGQSPHYYPNLQSGEYTDVPDNTTILGAMKVTGKTSTGWTLGLLSSVTAKESAEIRSGSETRDMTVEPLTSYTVARLQRDFNKGNHALGLMLTAVNRSIGEAHLEFLPQAAYTGGIDGTLQWADRTYYINGKAVFSHVTGHEDALARIQQSPVHFFQRTDASHLSFDSTRTQMSGTGGEIEIGKGGNGRWRFEESFTWRSPGLELNDVGFLSYTDLIEQSTEAAYVVNDPVGLLNNYSLSIEQSNLWNFDQVALGQKGELYGSVRFVNFWGVHGFVEGEVNPLQTHLLRGGPAMRLPDALKWHLHLQSDSRKRVQVNLGYFKTNFDDGISSQWEIWPDLHVRATDHIDFSLMPRYSENTDNWQYVTTQDMLVDSESSSRYILGQIDQKTFSLTLRLNYYITPDLSIQYYGQPFVSAGRYSDFKTVADSKAAAQEDRTVALTEDMITIDPETSAYLVDEDGDGFENYQFDNPDFNFREFRSNLVLRWEYKPGSTFYLVWTHGRSNTIPNGAFDFRRDMEDLFDVYANNVLMIKVNHWFSM